MWQGHKQLDWRRRGEGFVRRELVLYNKTCLGRATLRRQKDSYSFPGLVEFHRHLSPGRRILNTLYTTTLRIIDQMG
jgi:hypothetical protein